MNKTIRNLLATAALAFGVSALSAADVPVKLVVVDVSKVLDSHYRTEELKTKLEADAQKVKDQLGEMEKQAKQIEDQYKELVDRSNSAALNADAKAQAQAEAQKKVQEFQQLSGQAQQIRQQNEQLFNQRIKNHRELILEQIVKVAQDIGRARGATLVLDKTAISLLGVPSIVYSDASFDITEDVVKEVNKDRPATPPAASTPAPAPAPAPTAEKKP